MTQFVIAYTSANSQEQKIEFGEFADREEASRYAKRRYQQYFNSLMTREAWNKMRVNNG